MDSEISFQADASGIAATTVTGVIFFSLVFFTWVFWRRLLAPLYFPREIDNPVQYTLFKWFPQTWFFRSKNVLKRTGMKSVMLLKWKLHMIYFCLILIFFGALLLPIYVTQSDPSFAWFYRTTASALPLNSNYAWATFVFTVLISLFLQIMTIRHRSDYYNIKKKHQQLGGGYLRTVCVHNIPKALTDSNEIKDIIERLSKRKVELASIIWRPSKNNNIHSNQKKLAKLYTALEAYKRVWENSPNNERPLFRPYKGSIPGYLTCDHKIDAIEFFEGEIEKITEMNDKAIAKALQKKKHVGIAFVVFDSIKECEYVKSRWPFPKRSLDDISWDIRNWKIMSAVPVEEVIWSNLGSSSLPRNIKKTLSTLLVLLLALFWSVPIAFFGNLDNIALIPGIGPKISDLFQMYPVYYEYLAGLLPALLTLLLFTFFPQFCMYLSKLERHYHQGALNTSAMEKFWIFTFFNFFIFYLLFSSGIDMAQHLISDPSSFREAFENLDWELFGTFYCNYFISMTFFDGALSFVRPFTLMRKYFLRLLAFRGSIPQKNFIFRPSTLKLCEILPKEAVYFGIILTFAPIVPLVSLCGIMAYLMSYFTDKTLIVLCFSFDPGLGGKVMFRFMLFTHISLFMSYIFWMFFFASHGPEIIFYVCIPVYFGLWLINIGTLWWIVYYGKIHTSKDTELWSFLQDSPNSQYDPAKAYSWDFVTSPQGVKIYM